MVNYIDFTEFISILIVILMYLLVVCQNVGIKSKVIIFDKNIITHSI
jgi:hypothetical protein